MSTVFGEVAELYDNARPDYPARLAEQVLAYAGDVADAVEIGAGTGKATALFAGRGFPITCLEPDARMAALLTARLPGITVVPTTFEDWTPPPGGVDLVYAALVWHWLDPATRVPLAVRALRPGGTLAVIAHKTRLPDAGLADRIAAVFRDFETATGSDRPPLFQWALPDMEACPDLEDVATGTRAQDLTLSTDGYLRLMQTFAPFRGRSPELRRRLLTALGDTIDAYGGSLHARVETSLLLARRRRSA